MEEKYIVDRIEETYVVCENQLTGNLENIKRDELPQKILEGMLILKNNNGFKIDVMNSLIIIKKVVNKLKENWNDKENLYLVTNKLNNAIKCTNLGKKENIYIKDEKLIKILEKGNIIIKNGENFSIEKEKTEELKLALENFEK